MRVEGANGESRHVATLHAGDVFGELGLMTGQARAATVTATTEVVCYRLDRSGFSDIIKGRPVIAESIAQLMAHRRVELEAAREGLGVEAARHRIPHASRDLLHQIRTYFNLL
jgi:CRP-like cAMP-binding protein